MKNFFFKLPFFLVGTYFIGSFIFTPSKGDWDEWRPSNMLSQDFPNLATCSSWGRTHASGGFIKNYEQSKGYDWVGNAATTGAHISCRKVDWYWVGRAQEMKRIDQDDPQFQPVVYVPDNSPRDLSWVENRETEYTGTTDGPYQALLNERRLDIALESSFFTNKHAIEPLTDAITILSRDSLFTSSCNSLTDFFVINEAKREYKVACNQDTRSFFIRFDDSRPIIDIQG